MTPEESNRRMTELNWALEELERDLSAWRARVLTARGAAPTQGIPRARSEDYAKQPPQPAQEPFDEEAHWRRFTNQYRRPKEDPLRWRAWIGSDVACKNCGCVLNTWVHHCPDCGQRGTWKRSKMFLGFQHTDEFYFWLFWLLVFAVSVVGLATDFRDIF